MTQQPIRKSLPKPHFASAMRLRCPYCRQTPLQNEKSWFTFRQGCQTCDFKFEREAGYYTGASWMVMFPLVGLAGFLQAGLMMVFLPHLKSLEIACYTSLLMVLLSLIVVPYSMAFWMYCDHRIHPLTSDDVYH